MAAKARKKRKAGKKTSDGDATATGRGGTAADTEDTTARIEKKIEERLAKIESRVEDRLKSLRTAPSGNGESEDVESEETDVPVKELRRSTGSARSRTGTGKARARKGGLVEQLLSFLPGARPQDYDALIDTLEHMDEFGKVPDIENKLESFMMFLYERYWRVDTTGIEHIPNEGRTLIVSNHSGVLPFDGAMIGTAIWKFHPAKRYARFLIEDWFGRLPFATEFMNAVGQVRACQENAERLLRQEQLVGVFPEGIKGMAKGFKDRYNLARFGRGGVIRLAVRTRTPVVPCGVVGAEEIYIVLGYANWLGKMFGMPLFPITATFPWLGPLGFIPLPTKWYIQLGEIIRYDEYDESALKDNVIINRLNRQLRARIQEMVDSALKKRRSLFFG
jgi:1-acyl-sn-glycerol-3-phosphate acyltransferase